MEELQDLVIKTMIEEKDNTTNFNELKEYILDTLVKKYIEDIDYILEQDTVYTVKAGKEDYITLQELYNLLIQNKKETSIIVDEETMII